MKNNKFGFGNLLKSTPRWAKRTAKALVAVSTFVTGSALYSGNEKFAAIAFGCGAVGTFVMYLFTDDMS